MELLLCFHMFVGFTLWICHVLARQELHEILKEIGSGRDVTCYRRDKPSHAKNMVSSISR